MSGKDIYCQVINNLRQSYDHMAVERDKEEVSSWKRSERQRFLDLLHEEDKKTLLEIGAGTGVHGKFFQENGMQVICTDLSPEMVFLCREKGLTAYEMDFLNLDFPDNSFDSVFVLNCMLHVPRKDFGTVLRNLKNLLKPAGLLYLGQYGGKEYEGFLEDDSYEPKRFFSFLTDDQIQNFVEEYFSLINFKQITLEDDDYQIQSLLLQK